MEVDKLIGFVSEAVNVLKSACSQGKMKYIGFSDNETLNHFNNLIEEFRDVADMERSSLALRSVGLHQLQICSRHIN